MQGSQTGRARLGFGCVRLGSVSSGSSWRTHVRLVEHAIDQGVTTFDTADAYGSGVSERVLGRGVGRRRADVCIATKAGYLFTERSMAAHTLARSARPVVERLRRLRPGQSSTSSSTSPATASYERQDFSAGYLRGAVDASLRRLGTDYIDVFQLHGPTQVVPDLMEEVDRLKRAGKILRFGIGAESVSSAVQWLQVAGLDSLQVPFGVLDPQASFELFPQATQLGVEVWVRGVLGGGLLSRAAADEQLESDPKWPLIQQLGTLARQAGISVFRLALEYVRSFPEVSTVLIGVQSQRHFDDNLAMMSAAPIDQTVIDGVKDVLARWVGDHEQI
ncbi:MAG: aldo/keto reductase [Ilumatobacteraceae bacterium]